MHDPLLAVQYIGHDVLLVQFGSGNGLFKFHRPELKISTSVFFVNLEQSASGLTLKTDILPAPVLEVSLNGCGQTYKGSTIVNYNARVVLDLKIYHITTLEP